jgi:transposase-like protein
MYNMRTYGKDSREFKFEIMKRHYEGNKSVNELAREHGLSRQTIYGWCKQYKQYGRGAFIGCGHRRSTENEINRLCAEIERLRDENEALRRQTS